MIESLCKALTDSFWEAATQALCQVAEQVPGVIYQRSTQCFAPTTPRLYWISTECSVFGYFSTHPDTDSVIVFRYKFPEEGS